MRSAEIRKIIAGVEEIPTLPSVATRILTLTSEDSNANGSDLARLIQSDQALASKILKLANSPFYGCRENVSTLQRAISVLGFRMVRNAALSLSVFDLFKSSEKSLSASYEMFNLTDFWRHCAAVALASSLIAKRYGYPQPDEAFMAGLLHDIGKVVLLAHAEEEFRMVLETVRETRGNMLDVEEDLIGIGHTQVGRLLTEKWVLPNSLVDAIWLHHQPVQVSVGSVPNLPTIVRLANSLCHLNHIGASGNGCAYSVYSSVLSSLGIAEKESDKIAKEVLQRLEEFGDLFGLEMCPTEVYLSAVRRANAELGRLNVELDHQNRELEVRRKALDATKHILRQITPYSLPGETVRIIAASIQNSLETRTAMCFYLDESDEQVYGIVLSQDRPPKEIAWPIRGGVLAPVTSELSSEA
ncbi:MAG TPA: HDOD domain-containing protein, partial [bacterium]|nr:HDOD domain-containing protein [bacterium]